jgi:tetratricopeptide (TPR) repeat protein
VQAMESASISCPRTRGLEHFHRREFSDALDCFDRSLATRPLDRELHSYKARALEGLGRLEESLSCVDRCLEMEPKNLGELCNRALLLTRLSRRVEALATFDEVLQIQPRHVDALIKRSFLLHQLGRRDEALASAQRAVSLAPADLNALNTRGMIFDDLGRREDALADFQAILAINPQYSDAMTNRGILYARAGQFREALACYDRSLSLNPDQPNAFYNRAVIRLVLGDWRRGFAEFECRWALFPHEAARLSRLAPLWSGEDGIAGKTVLLHHEQGYGDTLQFSRYAALVAKRGARVIVAAPAGLRRLLKTLPGSPHIVSEGEAVPAHDYHCPLMSLPRAFGTTPDTVPTHVPYLRADPIDAQRWGERLGKRSRARIGVVWSGRQYPPINYVRDMSLDAVRPLFDLRADFVCLHTELSDRERTDLASIPNVVWLGDQLKDFADTAGLMDNLDLMITVDSAVAHLAGALGKPVWVMNRFASCWRWLLERTDSPWYPSLRLFRQSALGDWAGVVHEVLQAGDAFIRHNQNQGLVSRSRNDPSSVQSEFSLAGMLQEALDQHNRGQLTEAIATYRRILAVWPDQFDTLHYLGVALAQGGKFQEALEPLGRALSVRSDSAVAHNHYGNALAGLSRYAEAIQSYERAIVCDGGVADSHYNRGVAFMALGQHEAALASYAQANELNPGYAQAHNNRGIVLADLGKLPEALASYECAIKAYPDFLDAWINRGDLLRRLHRYEESLESNARAVSLGPHHPEAHNGRGATLADLGRYDEAMASYDRAIELNPVSAEAIWNKGLIELSRGDLQQGWRHYESRWRVKSLKLMQRFSDKPQWRGESVNQKVVLLHAEQGYGDTIQFSRFCAQVAALGARVVLSVPTALQALLRNLPGVHELVGQDKGPAFDLHCPLMSLPSVLGTALGDIPAPDRYLQADPVARARWAERVHKRTQVPTVGLVWSGRPTHQKDFTRSIALQQLLPMIRCPVRWVSLQKEVRPSDREVLANTPAIQRLGEELTDFADAAALIENLDLVITVDTAVAHLAGALGKPVWILLPFVADWRWLQGREDSPWYLTARLFRQSASGDWAPVIERVGGELHGLLAIESRKPLKGVTKSRQSRARPGKKGSRGITGQ